MLWASFAATGTGDISLVEKGIYAIKYQQILKANLSEVSLYMSWRWKEDDIWSMKMILNVAYNKLPKEVQAEGSAKVPWPKYQQQYVERQFTE